jgi:prolipoprotein diacylglyceryltransferase
MFRLYLVLYGSFRLLEEFVRGDSPMPDTGFMKPVQWLLLIAVLYFARVFYSNELKPKTAS